MGRKVLGWMVGEVLGGEEGSRFWVGRKVLGWMVGEVLGWGGRFWVGWWGRFWVGRKVLGWMVGEVLGGEEGFGLDGGGGL